MPGIRVNLGSGPGLALPHLCPWTPLPFSIVTRRVLGLIVQLPFLNLSPRRVLESR